MTAGSHALNSLANCARTPAGRFRNELLVSILLGVVTTIGAALLHMKLAPLRQEMLMMQGRAVVDSADPPRWLAVVCDSKGARAVLSSPAAAIDADLITDILRSQRERGTPSLPSWSVLHSTSAVESGQTFEQTHGVPAPMIYRAAREERSVDPANEAQKTWGILPVGAALNVVVFSLTLLFLIRLPGSLRRAQHWFAAKRGTDIPHLGPLPEGEGERITAA